METSETFIIGDCSEQRFRKHDSRAVSLWSLKNRGGDIDTIGDPAAEWSQSSRATVS